MAPPWKKYFRRSCVCDLSRFRITYDTTLWVKTIG